MSDQFPVDAIRTRFPAIAHAGRFMFFDNAGGAQIPSSVLDAVTEHLVVRNVQRGGPYAQSREVDAMIARARESVAAFVNAPSADEIAFGLNATSFIRSISLAVGQTLDARREIVVSDLDHEANVATWLAPRARRRADRVVARAVDSGGARLDPADLDALVSARTRLVACTMASNATGSIVDIADAARRAHRAGAEVFVDAVHYAPHGPIDVRALDCDYLVCSGYKVFAPHMGFAWCRRESINRLPTFREDVHSRRDAGQARGRHLRLRKRRRHGRGGRVPRRPGPPLLGPSGVAHRGDPRSDGGDCRVRAHVVGASHRGSGARSRVTVHGPTAAIVCTSASRHSASASPGARRRTLPTSSRGAMSARAAVTCIRRG